MRPFVSPLCVSVFLNVFICFVNYVCVSLFRYYVRSSLLLLVIVLYVGSSFFFSLVMYFCIYFGFVSCYTFFPI